MPSASRKPFPWEPESVLTAVGCGLIMVTDQGRVAFLNPAAESLLDTSAATVLGRDLAQILPGLAAFLPKALKDGTVCPGIRLDIGPAAIWAKIRPVGEGGAVCTLTGLPKGLDFSDQKADLQLDAVFDSSYDGLFITDGEGKILKCNRSSERLVGHLEKDIIGRNVKDLVAQGYIDKSVTVEVIRKKTSLTILQKLRNGKTIIVTGTPVFDENGAIAFVVTNERDITSLNRMKDQLRQYRALAKRQLAAQMDDGLFDDTDITAVDRKTFKVFKKAEIAAKFDATVLIQGETGVGKGRVARFIHEHSPRKNGPFVQINCGAIPEQLIESELFGYRKGAFTGADAAGKPGLFHMADKGTLFLDEISEIPLRFQVKFLKAIEDKEILSVGDTSPRRVDVRIIAATNKLLEDLVAQGQFRKDLFFRLNVVPIRIPPLRHRSEDIVHLISRFLEKINSKFQSQKYFSPEAMNMLMAYSYPGNIRELENIIERIVILCPDDEIRTRHLVGSLSEPSCGQNEFSLPLEGISLKEALANYEQALIRRAVEKYGSKAGAVRALGVDPSTIVRKFRKHSSDLNDAILHD